MHRVSCHHPARFGDELLQRWSQADLHQPHPFGGQRWPRREGFEAPVVATTTHGGPPGKIVWCPISPAAPSGPSRSRPSITTPPTNAGADRKERHRQVFATAAVAKLQFPPASRCGRR